MSRPPERTEIKQRVKDWLNSRSKGGYQSGELASFVADLFSEYFPVSNNGNTYEIRCMSCSGAGYVHNSCLGWVGCNNCNGSGYEKITVGDKE